MGSVAILFEEGKENQQKPIKRWIEISVRPKDIFAPKATEREVPISAGTGITAGTPKGAERG